MCANFQSVSSAAQEGFVPVRNATLYYREIGQGQPILLLHGGPDFDHTYLLPDMDRLADTFRLIYYDQRGRGKSARNVQPEEVTIQSEVEDIEHLRAYFRLESVPALGHSWGALLAMEYALRHPKRVSHLILMNTAPASHDDFLLLGQYRRQRPAADLVKMKELSSTTKYQDGDPDTVAEYYRSHFRATLKQPELLEALIKSLRSSFTNEDILKAREIEERLVRETWSSSEYNLLPKLRQLTIPTLILHGDHDHIPVECASHIAESIVSSRFVVLRDCGHFSYLECPAEVRKEIENFFSMNSLNS
jgi:proline iminopeptidase